ncbi:MAG: hypothetical protein GTO14_10575, partial [Anaerolineales bacterium]|nr:hypothetical protein [Anaerolineales bacterium]
MSDQVDWPDPENIPGADLERYKAELELELMKVQSGIDRESARAAANLAREKAAHAAEYASILEVDKAYIEVAKGQIARSIERADFIQKVSAAIGTVYIGILGLTYNAAVTTVSSTLSGEEVKAALDLRLLSVTGVAAPIFLALSFFLSAVYVAYLTEPSEKVKPHPSDGSLLGNQRARRDSFVKWTTFSVMRRKYWLQSAIVSLGFGIILLPSAFLNFTDLAVVALIIAGVVATFVLPK